MSNISANHKLYAQIAQLLQAARQNVVRAVNQTMVYTNYEIGRMIVEDEQHGKKRAEYGKQILKELSIKLTAEFGKGFSVQNLENMRKFYLLYSIDANSQSVLRISEKSQSAIRISEKENTVLSWTHYLAWVQVSTAMDPLAKRSCPQRTATGFAVRGAATKPRSTTRPRPKKPHGRLLFESIVCIFGCRQFTRPEEHATFQNRGCPRPKPAAEVPKTVDSDFDGLARLWDLCV